jgi:large subunit ribosomal protein L4
MPKLALRNIQGERIGEIELNDAVFGITPNESVLYDFVKMQLANKRAGTASTKTRAEVSGGGKKPWRQKGTGRARAGSTRNPLWRHGGVVFGPKPRSYAYRLPRKVRRLAMKSALSGKALSGDIIVVDRLALEEPKTKTMAGILRALSVGRKTLLVTGDGNENVYKSARNIPGVRPVRFDYMSVYDILNCRTLLMTQDAVRKVEEALA